MIQKSIEEKDEKKKEFGKKSKRILLLIDCFM